MMRTHLSQLLLYLLIPVAATIAGGVIAAFRTPGPALRSGIQHFAAGVVFAAAAGEILPDVMSRHAPWEVMTGFSAGVASMLLIRWAGKRFGAGAEGSTPVALIAALAVDVLIDGLLLGVAFAAGEKTGILLTVALTLELLFLGLSAATALGAGRKRVIGVTCCLAILVLVGAAVGLLGLSHLPPRAMEIMLSFGLAALLYLVTEELLVEAHEVPETPWSTAVFFVGFLALLMLEMSMAAGSATAR